MVKNRKWLINYGYCFTLAFLFLMICSKNSFLYRINDWVDANAFFTVGKGMVRGDIPYLDLFEQKGPLLYLIYGLGSLISYKSFLGVFLLEVVSFSIFLYYAYKTISLFFDEKKAYFILPIFILCIVTLNSFSHGGSAEEFSLPFLMMSLYYLVLYLKSKNILISKKTVFLVGFLAGCILWIKYTLLGFWFGWMLCIFGFECYHGKYKEAFLNCFIFLFGMFAATIPWLIYFGINNALNSLWDVYFIVNINAYPKSLSLLDKIFKTFGLLYKNLFFNIRTFLGIIVGFICLFIRGDCWGKRGSNLALLTCLLTTGIFIYIGGTNYHYYPFILSPFLLVGFMVLFSYLKNIKWARFIIPCLSLSLIMTYILCGNTKMIKLKKEDYAQHRFAKIIRQSSDKTLLNYGFLDGGFYTAVGDRPKFYYFMKNNISYQKYPEMMNSQKEYVKQKNPHYVVIKNTLSSDSVRLIEQNYKLIDKYSQRYQTKKITYLLYERK